jgi:hypothetical protein
MPPGDLSCLKEKMMMKVRVILVCTLLLLVAVPSFALPLCGHCNEWNMCESAPGDFERCKYDLNGNCITTPERCSIPHGATTVLTEWTVASIEISCPAPDSVTVASPAPATEVPAATPVAQTTDLQ